MFEWTKRSQRGQLNSVYLVFSEYNTHAREMQIEGGVHGNARNEGVEKSITEVYQRRAPWLQAGTYYLPHLPGSSCP